MRREEEEISQCVYIARTLFNPAILFSADIYAQQIAKHLVVLEIDMVEKLHGS